MDHKIKRDSERKGANVAMNEVEKFTGKELAVIALIFGLVAAGISASLLEIPFFSFGTFAGLIGFFFVGMLAPSFFAKSKNAQIAAIVIVDLIFILVVLFMSKGQ